MVDYFASGYAWQTFKRFERRLWHTLEYVPLDKAHDNVWSPIFRELLTQICAEIDSFFRNMVNSESINTFETVVALRDRIDQLDMANYRQVFEPIFKLSSVTIAVCDEIHTYDNIKPFEAFTNDKSPDWWQNHNHVKHNWAENYGKANLRNTVCSLAGLFLLNVLHKECQRYLVFDEKRIQTAMPDFNTGQPVSAGVLWSDFLKQSFIGTQMGPVWVETRLFRHDFRLDRL